MKRRWAITIVAGALAFASVPHAGAAERAPRWVHEAGGYSWQSGYDVALDGAGTIVARADGAMGGDEIKKAIERVAA